MNKVGEIKKTDLELANEALIELSPNVSALDRKRCGVSKSVLIQYLKGQGTELDTAIKLIKFFRERSNERRKIIANEI